MRNKLVVPAWRLHASDWRLSGAALITWCCMWWKSSWLEDWFSSSHIVGALQVTGRSKPRHKLHKSTHKQPPVRVASEHFRNYFSLLSFFCVLCCLFLLFLIGLFDSVVLNAVVRLQWSVPAKQHFIIHPKQYRTSRWGLAFHPPKHVFLAPNPRILDRSVSVLMFLWCFRTFERIQSGSVGLILWAWVKVVFTSCAGFWLGRDVLTDHFLSRQSLRVCVDKSRVWWCIVCARGRFPAEVLVSQSNFLEPCWLQGITQSTGRVWSGGPTDARVHVRSDTSVPPCRRQSYIWMYVKSQLCCASIVYRCTTWALMILTDYNMEKLALGQ